MEKNEFLLRKYLNFCSNQKRLSFKTFKAYETDISQFLAFIRQEYTLLNTPQSKFEEYIKELHIKYKPKTVKRKIASLKAFFRFLLSSDYIQTDPWTKIQIHFREPKVLPRTIPMHTLEALLSLIYSEKNHPHSKVHLLRATRDIAVCELLFATGIRISELCSIKPSDIDFIEHSILIYGKGAKERIIHIGCPETFLAIKAYYNAYFPLIENSCYFFVSQSGRQLSDQSVRRMLNRYSLKLSPSLHITPHMFRHTFATSLLESDVDIRYIQKMLGHSSIHTTEIYTHVSLSKQKEILETKHPRKSLRIAIDSSQQKL